MSQCKYCLGIGLVMVQRTDGEGTTLVSEKCPNCQKTKPLHTCRECRYFSRAADDFIAACGAPVPMHVPQYAREVIAAVGPGDDATKCEAFEPKEEGAKEGR